MHSWEIVKQRADSCLIAIVSPPGGVSVDWALSWGNMQKPPIWDVMRLSGLPWDVARTQAAIQCLNGGYQFLFQLDSVPAYTPVLVKDENGRRDIKPISDLAQFNGNSVERRVPVENIWAWDIDKWVRVKQVIRHPFQGNLKRIRTSSGLLDITPNHSVFLYNKEEAADAGKIGVSDFLRQPRLWFKQDEDRQYERGIFFGGERLAWLYGLFAAEGCASYNHRAQKGFYISIANKDRALLERAQAILSELFCANTYIIKDTHVYKLDAENKPLYSIFRSKFYTASGDKKVPQEILDAPEKVQLEFLRGYNLGDGTKFNDKYKKDMEFQAFTTASPTLAAGLLYLINSLGLGYYNIQTRDDKPSAISIFFNKGNHAYKEQYEKALELREKKGWGSRKIAREVGIPEAAVKGWLYKGSQPNYLKPRSEVREVKDIYYEGYLYDLSTESERFCGGVGNFLLHNSDVLAPKDTIPG